MSNAARASVLTIAASLAAVCACAHKRDPDAARSRAAGVRLEVRVADGSNAGAPSARPSSTPPAEAIALLLRAMPPADRDALATRLDDAAATIAVKKNPLVEELDPHDPRAELAAALRSIAPALGASAALARGEWTTADRDVTVRVVTACDPSAARCLDPFAPADPSDALAARARFVAWPLASAIAVKVTPASAAPAVADALRARPADESTVAVVLRRADLEATGAPAGASVSHAAAALLAEIDGELPERDLIASFARAERAAAPAPALARVIDDDELLVVPRLSAVARAPQFAGEVQRRAAAVDGAHCHFRR